MGRSNENAMSFVGRELGRGLVWMGGCLLPSLFFCSNLLADTITLKNGKDLKGLVVEQHADRIILSTEKGEIPIFLKGVKNIRYDDPAQNFMKIGQAYESEGKLGEALAFYEKAAEVNPDFEEAEKAANGVRNRFWAQRTEGPRNQMETKQMIYDAWGQGRPIDQLIHKEVLEQTTALREGLGVSLDRKGDWICFDFVDPKKEAAVAGLRKNDRLVSMDGRSLRYLNEEVVVKDFLSPKFSNFTLEFERDCFVHKERNQVNLPDLGLKLRLEYQGLIIQSVKDGSPAAEAGLKEGDLLTRVDGTATRYMPLKKVVQLIQHSQEDRIVFTIRRSTLLVRR